MTRSLADACLRHSRRLVYTGGCFDCGDHGEGWMTEDTPLTPSPMGVGHARQAVYPGPASRRGGPRRGAAVPGFGYGLGGLFASAFVPALQLGAPLTDEVPFRAGMRSVEVG